MRIAVVSISYPPLISGVSTVAASLAQAMSRKNHQVSVFTANNKFKLEVIEKEKISEIRLPSIKSPLRQDVYVPVFKLFQIRKLVDQFKPQVFHLHGPDHLGKAIVRMAKMKKIPVIATHHFMPLFIESYVKGLVKAIPLTKSLIEKGVWKTAIDLYNQIDLVVTPTYTFRKLLWENGLKTKCEVVSNGTDLTRFKPNPKIKPEHLLYFGRLDQDKNLEVLVRSFAKSQSSRKLKLVIAGKGMELEKLKTLAADLGVEERIEFLGFVAEDKIVDLYRKTLVYVITSKVEAQSITTLQAVACGVPVVAARAGALPELVHDGKNGYLVAPDDIEATAKAIDKIIEDKKRWKEFSRESRQISLGHDIQKTYQRYEELLGSVI